MELGIAKCGIGVRSVSVINGGTIERQAQFLLRALHGRLSEACRFGVENLSSGRDCNLNVVQIRSEEHTSELQSLMRISYAVFCLKKKNIITIYQYNKHKHNDIR